MFDALHHTGAGWVVHDPPHQVLKLCGVPMHGGVGRRLKPALSLQHLHQGFGVRRAEEPFQGRLVLEELFSLWCVQDAAGL